MNVSRITSAAAAGAAALALGLVATGQAVARSPIHAAHDRSAIATLATRLQHADATARPAAKTTAHFDLPLGVAVNGAGDVYVANFLGNDVDEITPSYTIPKTFKITDGASAGLSIATDTQGNIYLGSFDGYVQEYSSSGSELQEFSANASDPASIAVDPFGDLYISDGNTLALDDPHGNSLSANLGTGIDSVAVGLPEVWGFEDGEVVVANGSDLLRSSGFELQYPGAGTGNAVLGSTCTPARLTCWFTDDDHTLRAITLAPGLGYAAVDSTTTLPYQPAGIAYDSTHDRLYITDPAANAIQVYNASTLALLKTLT